MLCRCFRDVKVLLKAVLPAWVVMTLKNCRRAVLTVCQNADRRNVQRRLDVAARRIAFNASKKIRVGFLVIYDKTFQLESVFRLMRDDGAFDAHILVIPDVSRGHENMSKSMAVTYSALREKYGNDVKLSYVGDYIFRDVSRDFDVCFVMNPYVGMSHRFYSFEYLARSGVLVCYSNYAFGEGTANAANFDHMPALNYLWRFFLDREPELSRMEKSQVLLKKNSRLRLVGAAKIDTLATIQQRSDRPITIIIAPHHSIQGNSTPLSMGNFDIYAAFFLNLPERYPGIHWVFRPHPLLFWTMKKVGVWTNDDEEKYKSKMMSFANVTYQDSGDYYDAFVNSDGLIQDSGSFLAEYHVTGHPQCYILRDRKAENSQFNVFGREMLSHTYKAYSEQDIINFIENVVLAGNDPMKEERSKFAKEKLMFNYPHASEAIVDDIKKALGRG